jgi:hypothetical protein
VVRSLASSAHKKIEKRNTEKNHEHPTPNAKYESWLEYPSHLEPRTEEEECFARSMGYEQPNQLAAWLLHGTRMFYDTIWKFEISRAYSHIKHRKQRSF